MATELYDTFTDTTGTRLPSHIMNVGGGWTEQNSSQWDIEANEARILLPGSGNASRVTANVGKADVTVQVVIRRSVAHHIDNGIMVNYVDGNNHWVVRATSITGKIHIYEKTGGSYIDRGNANYTWGFGETHTLKVIADGDTITAYVDEVQQATYTVASRPYKTVAVCGLDVDHGLGENSRWDNFLAETSGGLVRTLLGEVRPSNLLVTNVGFIRLLGN